MKNAVLMKGNRYGISLILNDEIPFDELLEELENKLESADEFFDCEKQVAVSFEGRTLSNDELDRILTVIDLKTNLKISYILDNNSDLETTFYEVIQAEADDKAAPAFKDEEEEGVLNREPVLPAYDVKEENSGLFYKGTLQRGQVFETPESVIVIGDVNKGASIAAGGNIVIIGSLKGKAKAGTRGDKNAFVMALNMEPEAIEIDGVPANEHTLKRAARNKRESLIAILINKQICIDPISKSAIHDFHF